MKTLEEIPNKIHYLLKFNKNYISERTSTLMDRARNNPTLRDKKSDILEIRNQIELCFDSNNTQKQLTLLDELDQIIPVNNGNTPPKSPARKRRKT